MQLGRGHGDGFPSGEVLDLGLPPANIFPIGVQHNQGRAADDAGTLLGGGGGGGGVHGDEEKLRVADSVHVEGVARQGDGLAVLEGLVVVEELVVEERWDAVVGGVSWPVSSTR